MFLLGILTLIFNANAQTSSPWEINDELMTIANGGDTVNSMVELNKHVTTDSETISKNIESTLAASGVKELQMKTSAYLKILKDGHIYTSNPQEFTYLKLPQEMDIVSIQTLDTTTFLANLNAPYFGGKSTIKIIDPKKMEIGQYGALSELDESAILDEFTMELYGLSKLKGEKFDQEVMKWFDSLGIKFGNVGPEMKFGFKIPLSDSHNGVTCTWSESEEIKMKV